jgi:hypothetical protein
MTENNGKTALILLGCPQVPVQTSMALYLVHGLKQQGIRPVVAGTRRRKTDEVDDPGGTTLRRMADLRHDFYEITEKERTSSSVSSSSTTTPIAYAGTRPTSQGALYALLSEHAEDLVDEIELPLEVVAAKPAQPHPAEAETRRGDARAVSSVKPEIIPHSLVSGGAEYIKKNAGSTQVEPGYKIRDVHIIGVARCMSASREDLIPLHQPATGPLSEGAAAGSSPRSGRKK